MSQVLGIAIADQRISSVVLDTADKSVVARNEFDSPNGTTQAIFDAVFGAVNSAPFMPSAVAISCASTDLKSDISRRFSQLGKETPKWVATTRVVHHAKSYAAVAHEDLQGYGPIGVVELASDGAPFGGDVVAIVNANTSEVIGKTGALSVGGERISAAEPDGTLVVIDALQLIQEQDDDIPAPEVMMVIGGGGEIPGVASALKEQLDIPVHVVQEPTYAAALGAALLAREITLAPRAGMKRWLIVAGLVGLLILIAAAIGLGIFSGNEDDPAPAPGTVTSVVPSGASPSIINPPPPEVIQSPVEITTQ